MNGHVSHELFVITDGTAMVSIPTQDGIARLGAFNAGMTFGEVGLLDHSPRSANITALAPVTCGTLPCPRHRPRNLRQHRMDGRSSALNRCSRLTDITKPQILGFVWLNFLSLKQNNTNEPK